jgi:hypothetical protein
MKQLNMVTLNQLPFPANHLAPGELRCENASHVDVATVERAAGFGLMGNLWEPPKSMGTTKFVIYYLCYTYNVVFCFDWVKGCRGDIPLENLDFGIIAPPVGTPWYIYTHIIDRYPCFAMLVCIASPPLQESLRSISAKARPAMKSTDVVVIFWIKICKFAQFWR